LALEKNELPFESAIAKPFLRWAGGKRWLAKHLTGISRLKFNNYYEPFLGGGATFFSICPPKRSYLSDLNVELIETYQSVKDNVDDVIESLKKFRNTEEYYYKIRDKKFPTPSERAARFIYLNHTSYNGIFRVNLKGVYNVPYGFRKKDFLDEATLRNAHSALQKASLASGDFMEILKKVKPRDFVFLDPPYTVSHNNNGFIKYNEKIFSLDDQIRLSSLIDGIKERGAYYILTNAAHKKIEEIFEKGDYKMIVNRASLIGGTNSQRGTTDELLFTNIKL
jgi:DNA adenine methylase